MMNLKVFDNFEEAMSLYLELGDRLEPEFAKSLNRTAHGVKTDVTKQIVSQRGISRKEVQDWKIRYARPGDLESQAVISGKRLGLEKFAPKPSTWMRGITSGGVTINLMGKSVQFRHAFMGINSANLRVLQRDRTHIPKQSGVDKPKVRRNRLRGKGMTYERNDRAKTWHMHHLHAISVPQIADDDDIVKVVIQNMSGRFLKQFDHLVDRLIQEYNT